MARSKVYQNADNFSINMLFRLKNFIAFIPAITTELKGDFNLILNFVDQETKKWPVQRLEREVNRSGLPADFVVTQQNFINEIKKIFKEREAKCLSLNDSEKVFLTIAMGVIFCANEESINSFLEMDN